MWSCFLWNYNKTQKCYRIRVVKIKSRCSCFPDTHRFFFSPHVHHGRTGSENDGVRLAVPAMTLDGFNTHTLEMATVSVTKSVLFPLKQEKRGNQVWKDNTISRFDRITISKSFENPIWSINYLQKGGEGMFSTFANATTQWRNTAVLSPNKESWFQY